MTGKTTLFTTVCTWDLAAFQVFSTAPATSPLAASGYALAAHHQRDHSHTEQRSHRFPFHFALPPINFVTSFSDTFRV